MTSQEPQTALIATEITPNVAIRNAVELWANATTSEGTRRDDLLRDKQQVVLAFFDFIDKHPAEVLPMDVRKWLATLEKQGRRPATIYQRACLLSSFYSWAMRAAELSSFIKSNPARLARPKAPKGSYYK